MPTTDPTSHEPLGATRDRSVWIVGLYFGGLSPTGVLLDGLATALAAGGYRVEVVTGRSVYGPGVNDSPRFAGPVHSLFSGPARPTGVVGRLRTWLAFHLSVVAFACTRRLPAAAILTTTPPLLHAAFALRRLMFRDRGRLVLWNQDCYPEILAAVGLLRRQGIPYRLFAAVDQWAVRRMDGVVALDRAMAALLSARGGPRPAVIPNWDVPRGEGAPPSEPDDLDAALAAARLRFRYVLLYSGNYGWGHDLEPLLAWFKGRPDQREFYLVFVGGGEKWLALTAAAAELGTERCWSTAYLPRPRFRRLLDQVDFGLVTLQDGCAGLMSPSKIHAYLAAGKPLVYLGPAGSNVADVIDSHGCGVRAGYDRPGAVAEALERLTRPDFDLRHMAARARQAACDRHSPAAASAAFNRLLRDLLGESVEKVRTAHLGKPLCVSP